MIFKAGSFPMHISLAMALGCIVTLAHAQDDIHTGQRPVLCAWGIYVELAKYGEICKLDENRDFLDALDANIARMDEFILRNSDFTREQLDAWQAVPTDVDADICEAGSEMRMIFESVLDYPIEQMNAQTDELLAVDRPPLADPCL